MAPNDVHVAPCTAVQYGTGTATGTGAGPVVGTGPGTVASRFTHPKTFWTLRPLLLLTVQPASTHPCLFSPLLFHQVAAWVHAAQMGVTAVHGRVAHSPNCVHSHPKLGHHSCLHRYAGQSRLMSVLSSHYDLSREAQLQTLEKLQPHWV